MISPSPPSSLPQQSSTPATTESIVTMPSKRTAHGMHIYVQTRHNMRVQTAKMTAIASRGFGRGVLPTRRTTPSLFTRRYSIDANTTADWGTQFEEVWDEEKPELQPPKTTYHELEPPPALSYQVLYPYPDRYAAFGPLFQLKPPYDENVYLELGDATICNAAFLNIGITNGRFIDAWMQDVSLDMCLEVLRRETDCNNHGIAIVTSLVSQICLYAANSQDSSPQEYFEYESRLRDKKWIFIVITDAESNFGDAIVGTHWSLVVLNRLNSVAYYFDSMFVDRKSYQQRACETSLGMLKIIGENDSLWNWRPQLNSPHQIIHNQMKNDSGACGPFVLKMTEVLITHIKDHQLDGKEDECHLELDEYFADTFRGLFHSGRVRRDMQRRLAHYKAIADAPIRADAHDHAAIAGLGIKLDDGPVVDFKIPQRSEESTQYEARQSHSYRRVGLNRYRYSSTEDENYTIHQASSGGGDMEIIELSDSEGNDYTDISMDEDCQTEEDEDVGASIYEPQNADDQFVSGSLPKTTNSPVHSGDENSPTGTNRINGFDMDGTVDVFVSGTSKKHAQSDDVD